MSDQELEKVDTGRRDFLKKSLVAGAVVWGAPAVTSLPAGRAWAQAYPCVNACTAVDAFGLQITTPITGTLTFPAAPGPQPTCVINPTVPGLIDLAATICGDIDPATCRARGYVEDLDLSIANILGVEVLSIQATILEAQAGPDRPCPDCANVGTSQIAGLVINGGAINVTSPCNTTIPLAGLVTVHINEQTCNADGTITVNALRVEVPALGIEVIAGQATAGAADCVCTPCA